jgi:hypothetical protein
MDEERIEIRAMKFAEAYYERLGWTVVNVARVRGDHAGYDLFLEKDSERMTVEVKGCSRLYQIPDLYDTEINRETKQLIADELCVVYYVRPGNAPKIARIPRAAILPEFIVPKYGYRISGRFKNERTIKKFVVDLDDSA